MMFIEVKRKYKTKFTEHPKTTVNEKIETIQTEA